MTRKEKQLSNIHTLHGLESIDQIVADLRTRGYELRFRREAIGLNCTELSYLITPDDFNVDEYYHFEDALHTDRERTLYAVSLVQGLKGFLVDACFVYEDNISPEMAQKLKW